MEPELIVKSNRAYTADHVLVRIIQVKYNVTPISVLRQHFLRFGEIEKFEAVYECKPYQSKGVKMIYITYVDPQAACRVLSRGQHRFSDESVVVRRANSWLQPEKEKAVRVGEEISYPAANEGLNIVQLPVICIESIFELLELSDQIRFVRAHGNIQFAFETYCRYKYKKFDLTLTKKMTLWEIHDFLGIAGKYIVEVNGVLQREIADYVIDYLTDFCPYLEYVGLQNTIISQDTLRNFLKNLRNLRQLNIEHSRLDERILRALKDAKKLNTLNFKNVLIAGEYLKKLKHIEHLSFQCCFVLSLMVNLHESPSLLRNLRSLDLGNIVHPEPFFYNAIDQHCQQLETFKMTEPPYSYERVALLPRLKHLEIKQHVRGQSVKIISKLRQHMANQLEILKIYSPSSLTDADITNISELHELKILSIPYNRDAVSNVGLAQLGKLSLLEELIITGSDEVTNEALLRLVKKLPKLQMLDIQFCGKITNTFIEDIALMGRGFWRKLTIYTYGTSVRQELLLQAATTFRHIGLNIIYEFTNDGYIACSYPFLLLPNSAFYSGLFF